MLNMCGLLVLARSEGPGVLRWSLAGKKCAQLQEQFSPKSQFQMLTTFAHSSGRRRVVQVVPPHAKEKLRNIMEKHC